MDLARYTQPIELTADTLAAGAFATAAAIAASLLSSLSPGAVALVAFVPLLTILRRIEVAEAAYPLPAFELAPVDAVLEPDELLLTAELMLDSGTLDELLLDDVLAEIEPDARVVRLFEPRRMPSAGELTTSIDQHLRATQSGSAPPDASQALSDALAQLRRSLR